MQRRHRLHRGTERRRLRPLVRKAEGRWCNRSPGRDVSDVGARRAIVTWYTLGIGLAAGLGAVLGPWFLRW
jgi:hypothetical protein